MDRFCLKILEEIYFQQKILMPGVNREFKLNVFPSNFPTKINDKINKGVFQQFTFFRPNEEEEWIFMGKGIATTNSRNLTSFKH